MILVIETVPRLAKTLSVTTLARTIQASFQRIQFTPDLLPADLIGTLIYNPRSGDFTTRKGPIFTNIILADEIYMDEKVEDYILNIVQATRTPEKYGLDVGKLIQYGASPRATIYLAMASRTPSCRGAAT